MSAGVPRVSEVQAVGADAILARLDRLDGVIGAIDTEADANYREHLALRERRDIAVAEQRELITKLRLLAGEEVE